jgi:hypothetical protein
VRIALGLPLRVVRLTVPLPVIEQGLALDATSGGRDDLREAATAIAIAEGSGVEEVVISNDRPTAVVARQVVVRGSPESVDTSNWLILPVRVCPSWQSASPSEHLAS